MAYTNISENYRTVVYSGDAVYDCKLYINNGLISPEQISSIKISSPIIDNTSDTGSMFHIGTFISQKLDIKFRNLDGIILNNNPEIYLEIGLIVNNQYEYVPIGKYLIDELSENYQTTCEITCMDYGIKFKTPLDISQFFGDNNSISASDLFEAICNYYGVTVGTYPSVNNSKLIYTYDNSITGKQYIMYLAELFGGNAKIGRDGSCNIFSLKSPSVTNIDIPSAKSFKIGERYTLSRICYDNGRVKYQAGGNVISVQELPEEGIDLNAYYYLTTDMKYYKYIEEEWQESTDIKNTLYLRNDNPFITQQTDIDEIYSSLEGFSIYNIEVENRMDLSLDSWDVVKYVDGNKDYDALYNNEIEFNGVSMGKVTVDIPIKTKEETTNVIRQNEPSQIYSLKTTINEQQNLIETTISELNEEVGKTNTLTETVDGLSQRLTDNTDELYARIAELETTINGLQLQLTQSGGNNIFYYAKEFWTGQTDDSSPNLEEYTSTERQKNTVSGLGYQIKQGHSQQKVQVKNDSYVISFLYKKETALATGYVRVNNEQYDLTATDWTELVIPIDIDTGSINFQVYSDTNNAFYIFDLMGNIGTEKEIWTQNPNETRTDTVTIGRGVQVNSSTTNTYTRIDADGNRVINTDTGDVVMEATDKGVKTQQLEAVSAKIDGILIQEIDGQTWISSLS